MEFFVHAESHANSSFINNYASIFYWNSARGYIRRSDIIGVAFQLQEKYDIRYFSFFWKDILFITVRRFMFGISVRGLSTHNCLSNRVCQTVFFLFFNFS